MVNAIYYFAGKHYKIREFLRQFEWLSSVLLLVALILSFAIGLTPQALAADQGQTAIAQIKGSGISGTLVAIESTPGIVQLSISIKGDPKILTPGQHGFHLHEVGVCDETTSPKFSSAKGHFDPGPFGSSLPVEKNHPYHLGDLPNLTVDTKGVGKLETVTTRISLMNSPVSVFDADGTAVILHKNKDLVKANGTAEEAGGGRLACGVLQAYGNSASLRAKSLYAE